MIKLNQNRNLIALALLQLSSLVLFPGYAHASTSYSHSVLRNSALYRPADPNDCVYDHQQQTMAPESSWQSQYQRLLNNAYVPDNQSRAPYQGRSADKGRRYLQKRVYTTRPLQASQSEEETEAQLSIIRNQQLELLALVEQGYVNLGRNEYLFVQIQRTRHISMFNYVYLVKVYLQNMYRMFEVIEVHDGSRGAYDDRMQEIVDLMLKLDEVLDQIANECVMLGYTKPRYEDEYGMITSAELDTTALCDSLKRIDIVNNTLGQFHKDSSAADELVKKTLEATRLCNDKLTAAVSVMKEHYEQVIGLEELDSEAFNRAVTLASSRLDASKVGQLMHEIVPLVESINEFVTYVKDTGVGISKLESDLQQQADPQASKIARQQAAVAQAKSSLSHSKTMEPSKVLMGVHDNMFTFQSTSKSTKSASAPQKSQKLTSGFASVFAKTDWKQYAPKSYGKSKVLEPLPTGKPIKQTQRPYRPLRKERKPGYASNHRLNQLQHNVYERAKLRHLRTDPLVEEEYDE